jgi:hypothetical protein
MCPEQSTEEFLNSLETEPAKRNTDDPLGRKQREKMTASQRFILSLLFFFFVLTVGSFVLLIANRIILPI